MCLRVVMCIHIFIHLDSPSLSTWIHVYTYTIYISSYLCTCTYMCIYVCIIFDNPSLSPSLILTC